MSSRLLRRTFFALALLTIPFPYQVVEGGRVPVAWLVTVAAVVVTSAVRQGGSISATIAQWFAIQAGLAVLLAYATAGLAATIVRRTVPAAWQRSAVGLVVATALGAALFPIFASSAVRGGTPTNLLGIFALG
jgi:hypothetical protein